jgi:hypothetical protein
MVTATMISDRRPPCGCRVSITTKQPAAAQLGEHLRHGATSEAFDKDAIVTIANGEAWRSIAAPAAMGRHRTTGQP